MSVLSYVPGTKAWQGRRDRRLCKQTAARMQEIVDGEFPPGRRARLLSKHLEACERCYGRAEAVRQLKLAVARCADDADPQMLSKLQDLARLLCDEPEAVT